MRFFRDHAPLYAVIILTAAALSLIASKAVCLHSVLTAAPADIPPVIVIDPGHGGEDGGALSCTGKKESGFNLEIGLRLNDLLIMLGQRTVMTRTEDISVADPGAKTLSEKKVSDLRNRVDLVNRIQGAVLVSIHQNTFPEAKYKGAQVFYAKTEGSEELGRLTQQRLREGLDPENQRECKPSLTVYLMNKIQCPGILVECGFLSNGSEEYSLTQPEYQRRLVCAAAGAITEYLAQRGKS